MIQFLNVASKPLRILVFGQSALTFALMIVRAQCESHADIKVRSARFQSLRFHYSIDDNGQECIEVSKTDDSLDCLTE
jgi:hypothetical protein